MKFAGETAEEAREANPEFDGSTRGELADRLLPMSENGLPRE